MELRQLEYLVAVAEEANFTRAAQRVHISQSGISAQIRQLEGELGAELIDRSSRVASLTVAGEAALIHAKAALAAVRAITEAVGEVTAVIRGRIRVGMVSGCTVTPLFEALAAFHGSHPGVDLVVSEANSDELIASVRTGRLDVALVGVPVAPPTDLESLTLISEGLTALVPSQHPLAETVSITVADLAGQQLICMPSGTGIRAVLDMVLADQGHSALVHIEASAPAAIADLARRGLGVAVLSESMAAIAPDLIPLPIEDADIPTALALVWAPMPGPALRRLLEHCAQRFPTAGAAKTTTTAHDEDPVGQVAPPIPP